MISVTDEAGDLLINMLVQAGMLQRKECAFRLIRDQKRDVGMLVPGTEEACDVPVVYHDRTVLLLTAPVADTLDGRTLDVVHQGDDQREISLVWRSRRASTSAAADAGRDVPSIVVNPEGIGAKASP